MSMFLKYVLKTLQKKNIFLNFDVSFKKRADI